MPADRFTLRLAPDVLSVCRLDAAAPIPGWADGPGFVSITRTAGELSIICAADRVPAGVRRDGPWRVLEVVGPFDFGVTGVIAALARPLAAAGISLLPVATFDTDHLLVKADAVEAALRALAAAGHRID